MAHERRLIREAIRAQLAAASTSAGARVYETRMGPLRTVELPAIAVYTEDETVDPKSLDTAPRELTRTVQVAVEGWARAAADVDDVLDGLALEIETALDADCEFGATCYSSILTSTELGVKLDGDRPMGAVRLLYTVVYHTDLRVPPVADDLSTAGIQYNLTGAQAEADRAKDTLDDLET